MLDKTTQTAMFTPARPYTFHIELTDKCNARCPMCPRTNHLDHCRPNRDVVHNVELTLADFQEHFTPEFCARTEKVIFGGAYGDPLAAPELLEIVEHLTDHGVGVAIATNGSLRKPDWWARMGRAMARTNSALELHIDGLEDTTALYRIGTDYAKIVENAAAFIATGARAEWHFILFGHNEHQVEEAHRRSRQMGFAGFTLIDSIRFGPKGEFHFQKPDGSDGRYWEPKRKAADFALADDGSLTIAPPEPADLNPARVQGIDCKSARRNSPYISAHGIVSACCWMTDSAEEAAFNAEHGLAKPHFSIRHRPLAEIMADEPFASYYAQAWDADRLRTCQIKCGRAQKQNKRNSL
ncbi:radical SAM protein [Rhodobacteraceae bacterium NNCM2]|nr:radical SAM protein [Coraliihabitans acroporae]